MFRFLRHVQLYQWTSYTEIDTSLWLSLRLQLLAAVIVSFVTVMAIIGTHGYFPVNFGTRGLVLTKDAPPRKTYVYRVDVPVAAQWISLVVAPFEILHDSHCKLISYICLPATQSKLRNTVTFFYNAFRTLDIHKIPADKEKTGN